MKLILIASALFFSALSIAATNDLLIILDDQGILCNVRESSKECLVRAQKVVKENISCESKVFKMLNSQIVCTAETQGVAEALNAYEELPCNTTSIDLEIAKGELSNCLSIATNSCF